MSGLACHSCMAFTPEANLVPLYIISASVTHSQTRSDLSGSKLPCMLQMCST